MTTWFNRITSGLRRSTGNLAQGVKQALGVAVKLDAATETALEEALLAADTGLPAAQSLLAALKKSKLPEPLTEEVLRQALADAVATRLAPLEKELELQKNGPTVIVVAGVNGAGKTTTIGKLAAQWAEQGKKVVIAAADTFRVAAVEQLAVWSDRAASKGSVNIVQPQKPGADPAGVAYAALEQALETKADIVLVDTAGRLPNRQDLLAELPKITRVLQKLLPDAPHHTLLVLDATLGQSTLSQVTQFAQQTGLTGLIVTKLDGTARAGFLLALAAQSHPLPVVAIGVGEGLNDLGPFNSVYFSKALLGLANGGEKA